MQGPTTDDYKYQSHKGSDCLIQIETREEEKLIFLRSILQAAFQKNFTIESKNQMISHYHRSTFSTKCWEFFFNLVEYQGDEPRELEKGFEGEDFLQNYKAFSDYYGLTEYYGVKVLEDFKKSNH